MGQQVYFSEVSLYCAWPHIGALPPPAVATASESAETSVSSTMTPLVPYEGVESDASNSASPLEDSTPSGRRYRVYAYPVALRQWQVQWITAVASDGVSDFSLEELPVMIPRLLLGAERVVPKGVPTYYVLHLGRVELRGGALAAWKEQNAGVNSSTGGLSGPPRVSGAVYQALVDQLDAAVASLRPAMSLARHDIPSDDLPRETAIDTREHLYFAHYSPTIRRRGHLVLTPQMSLLVDAGQEDVYVLLELAQQALLTTNGLATGPYSTLMNRVILWDANTDTQASLDDLVHINRSTVRATVGEVAMNLALAALSGLLAALLVKNLVSKQLAYPLVLFGLAALAFAIYAPTEWRWYSRIGLILVALSVMLTVGILFIPAITSWLPVP